MDLFQLPDLVKEHLISKYLKKEKLNLAVCSSYHCNSLAYILWQEIFIPWGDLQLPEQLSFSVKSNLGYVRALNFVNRAPAPVSSLSGEWGKVVDKFHTILDNCNVVRVRTFTSHNMLTDRGMEMMCQKLTNLREVTFVDCTDLSVSGWEQLVSLRSLKKLTLQNCFIRNTGIETIVNIVNLEELNLNIDWKDNIYITRNALKHISSMQKLKKLTISCSYELELSQRDLKCLKILDKLKSLSLEQTLLDDQALWFLCKCAGNLQNLNIRGCHEITEKGLFELVHLPSLRKVNLQDIKLSSTALTIFAKETGMKEMADPHEGIFRKIK